MTLSKTLAGLSLLVLVAAPAIANEYVYGSSYTMEGAMQAAEARGAERAKAWGTCYKPAEPQNCKKQSDGTWLCHVSVSEYTKQGGGMCSR